MIRIPVRATPYVLMQRTGLHRHLRRLRGWGLTASQAARVEGFLCARRVRSEYVNVIRQEFESVKPYLPQSASRTLDIGCGAALIDVFVARHLIEGGSDVHVHLLDRTALSERVFYGFKSQAAFYNSLSLSHKILRANGVRDDRIHLHDPDDLQELGEHRFDLVLSLISWGFHYPVSTYLEFVRDRLAPSGRLILDVRKETDGIEELRATFPFTKTILEGQKHERIVASHSQL